MYHHSFRRSGIAAVSDLNTEEWRTTFSCLEEAQCAFLAEEDHFRSPEYRWPRDALHQWSRIWEYPYAYRNLREALPAEGRPMVADVGSGVTFFPFAVARLGYRVVCVDQDPICEEDIARANARVPHAPGEISFRRNDGNCMPFSAGELDGAYCISVLEHVDRPAELVQEVARALRPGGIFVATIDLAVSGDGHIGIEKHGELALALDEAFEFVHPVTSTHPADMLNSLSGPYAEPQGGRLGKLWWFLKQELVKPILGRTPRAWQQLAIEGYALKRRIG